MTSPSDSPNAARPVGSHRQQKIAHANARTNALIRQRVDWYRARGWNEDKIARIVGVPIETVSAQHSG